MLTHVSEGKILSLTSPTGGVTKDVGVVVGGRFVVPLDTVAATLTFQGLASGVVSQPRETGGGSAWSEGDTVYWDEGNDRATLTAQSNKRIGVAAAAAADGDANGTIRLEDGGNKYFASAETAGTGSSQNVAHGLGVVPDVVIVELTEFADTLAVDVAKGTHTSTNAVVTVTSGAKFILHAFKL